MTENTIDLIDWEKVSELIPAIIQNSVTGQVLMLGYMNKEALTKTYQTGTVTFYSRTKKRLWTKGETSGNNLELVSISRDCDNDTLLIQVKPKGPCCHLNQMSCFNDQNASNMNIITILERMINDRDKERPEDSYVTNLLNDGISRIAQKVGEEGVEVALAGVSKLKQNIISESADLLFHLLILLQQSDITFDEILLELERRSK